MTFYFATHEGIPALQANGYFSQAQEHGSSVSYSNLLELHSVARAWEQLQGRNVKRWKYENGEVTEVQP